MNIIDLLLFLIILLAVFSGYRKGFILCALDLLLLTLGLLFAFWVYQPLASFFEKYITSIGAWTRPLAFILAYIFVRILLGALVRRGLRHLPTRMDENTVNKALGILPGAINGILYAAVFSAILLGLPVFDSLSQKTRESSIAMALVPKVEWAGEKFSPVFDEAINHSINMLTIKPGSTRSVDLGFTVKAPRVREDLEVRMLELVNEERKERGLPALSADPEMRKVARAHSRDMFAKGYFSHINKEGKMPGERARERGVRFITAGENLALAQTLQMAHDGLMNSRGHRANILNASFGRAGIGVLEGGRHGLMITQNFRN